MKKINIVMGFLGLMPFGTLSAYTVYFNNLTSKEATFNVGWSGGRIFANKKVPAFSKDHGGTGTKCPTWVQAWPEDNYDARVRENSIGSCSAVELTFYQRGDGSYGLLYKDWTNRVADAFVDAAQATSKALTYAFKDVIYEKGMRDIIWEKGLKGTLYEKGLKGTVWEKAIKPAADSIEPYANIAGKMVKNWFADDLPVHYCFADSATNNGQRFQIAYDAQIAEQRRKSYTDKTASTYDSLYKLAEKYAPIFYLQHSEKFSPIRAEEYFNGDHTALMKRDGTVLIPNGQITMEKIYEDYKKHAQEDPDNWQQYFAIEDCVKFGSNPALNKDKNGNLATPAYVVASEIGDKIYLQYMTFYGFNAPYDIGPFKGDVMDFQNAHESDLEHITLEFDKTTQKLTRIYYGSHGSTEGMWLNANNPDIEYVSETHPVAYVARGGHGIYPREGTYVRIFGVANDVTDKGTRWTPELIMVYPNTDPRFNAKTMGWLYPAATYGARGVSSASQKGWWMNAPAGDIGRPYAKVPFCPKPESTECLIEKIPSATAPD